jgi:PAS domain S-box-containing protein
MRVSEIRYRRLFEAAHDGVLLIDPGTCKIIDANPFMTLLLGYPRDQLIGKELFEIGLAQGRGREPGDVPQAEKKPRSPL